MLSKHSKRRIAIIESNSQKYGDTIECGQKYVITADVFKIVSPWFRLSAATELTQTRFHKVPPDMKFRKQETRKRHRVTSV